MTITVPGPVQPYIQQAAKGTGLPYGVVAAQVNDESGFRTGLVSSAGALGPYQFEPSTWAGLGFPAGQENNWTVATQAYIKYMRQLLAWAGGDVRKALAAYNAGPGNWQAGLGYANTILGAAGDVHPGKVGGAADSTSASSSGGGLWPSQVTGFFSGLDHAAGDLWGAAAGLFSPTPWIRAGAGLLAAVLLALGLVALARAAM